MTYSIRELIAKLQDLQDDGFRELSERELDEVVLERYPRHPQIGDLVIVTQDGDECEMILHEIDYALERATVFSEMTGIKYFCSMDEISLPETPLSKHMAAA